MTDQTLLAAAATPKHLTMSQALATYDAKMRATATLAGAPTNRTACAGMFLGGDIVRVVYTGLDGGVYSLDMRDGARGPTKITAPVLTTLLCDAYDLGDPQAEVHNTFVFADTDTMRRVAKMAERWSLDKPTQESRMLARILAFRLALPTSTFTPVLTEALAQRYWLPTGGALDNVTAWDAAFSHARAPLTRESFSYLIARVLDGPGVAEIIKAMTAGEKFGARAGQYGSDHAACSAFTKAGTVTDAYAALLSLDPMLRERNALSGAISEIRVHQVKADKIEAYVSETGKLREGSKVLVFDGSEFGKKVEVMLTSVEFVNDELMVVLKPPSKRDPNAHMIEEAKGSRRPLYLVPAPFLMVRRAPKNRRWTNHGDEKSLHVDIPLDIALAGAPVGD